MPGSPRWACTQSASTRTLERLIAYFSLSALAGVQILLASRDTSDEQVHLAAQADAEGSIQKRGDQRQRGRRDAKTRDPFRVADDTDDREHEADALSEPRRGFCLKFTWRREPWPDQVAVDQA